VNFIGWYHNQSHLKNGIELNDAYHLYLAYYFGQVAFDRGEWKNNTNMQKVARSTADMAYSYDTQLQACRQQ
jgi:hypothetical protein